MTITVEADRIAAMGNNDIRFLKSESDNLDLNYHVYAPDVLFITPLDKSTVERSAAGPSAAK